MEILLSINAEKLKYVIKQNYWLHMYLPSYTNYVCADGFAPP